MPLGPNAKRYIDLGKQLNDEFSKQGVRIQVVLAFSEPSTTSVIVGIGVGVAVQIVSKVIDQLLDLRLCGTDAAARVLLQA